MIPERSLQDVDSGNAARVPPLVVRLPNHLGDLVMALAAVELAGPADLVVAGWLASLVSLLPGRRRIITLERGRRGFVRAVREVGRGRYARGVLLTPSFSSALLFAAAGVRERRGLATDRRRLLLTDVVAPNGAAGLHRAGLYAMLIGAGTAGGVPVPRLALPDALRERWRSVLGPGAKPVVGVFPGSNASSRRWDPPRFGEVARRLAAQGARVVVFGGPTERALTAEVAADVAFDAGGRTDLPLLAAALAECDLLVTNDSGPLHLAAAVGTPTVSLWGAGDPASTGPLGSGHHLVRRPDLPCVPCVKNRCPREGRGYVLAEADRECLRLIQVDDVEAAVRALGIVSAV